MAKRKVNHLRMARSWLIIAIVLFLLYQLASHTIFNPDQTYKLEYGKLNLEDNYRSVIIRKEYMIGTYSTGSVRYVRSEGQKVDSGQKIMVLTHQSGIMGQTLQQQAGLVASDPLIPGQAIGSTLKQPSPLGTVPVPTLAEVTISPEAMTASIEANEKALADAILTKQYKRVRGLKKDLAQKIEKQAKIEKSKTSSEMGETSYHEIFYGGALSYAGQNIDFNAPVSGLLTYNMDGLEKMLTIENLYNIDYEKLISTGMSERNLSGDRLNAGGFAFKMVDSSLWYLVCLVDKEKMDLFDKNKGVIVSIGGENLNGTITDVFENPQNKGCVLIKLNEFYKDFYKVRFVDAKIIRENFQGLKIFKDSLVTKDSITGVYIKDINNKPAFMPVKVLGNDESFAIVKDGYINITKDDKTIRVKTLDIGDTVLRNGSKYLGQ